MKCGNAFLVPFPSVLSASLTLYRMNRAHPHKPSMINVRVPCLSLVYVLHYVPPQDIFCLFSLHVGSYKRITHGLYTGNVWISAVGNIRSRVHIFRLAHLL